MKGKAPIIILLVVLLIMAIILITWLNKSQKKNRHYDKKGVWLYALVSFLLAGLLGLLGLGDLSQLQDLFFLFQGFVLLMGILHVWLTFQLFAWADRASFLPEGLLTMFVAAVCTLAGLGSFWLVDSLINDKSEGTVMAMAQAFLWFPVPYLLVRTYDRWAMIPPRIYHAWRFPSYATPEFPVHQYQFVNVNLSRAGVGSQKTDISLRSRLPYEVRLGDFFHRFVAKYNDQNPHAPIEHLTHDEWGNPIGWSFSVRTSQGGSSRRLDPEQTAATQNIQEGDLLFAFRVRLDPETAEPEQRRYRSDSDDELIIGDPDDDDFGIEISER